MSTPGGPPPEGRLIEQAREARDLSQNGAAELAGISGTRWRQIVTGVASGGKGIQVPVHGRAKTVARMAQVVGVTPEDLVEVGREDAANELRRLPPPDGSERRATVEELEARVSELERELAEILKRERRREGTQDDQQRRDAG